MGFFGIGTGEILIILIIALIIIGPNKLPELAKILGKGFAEFKKATEDFKDSINEEIHHEREKQKLLESQPKEENPPITITPEENPEDTENSAKDKDGQKKDLF